MVPSPQDASDPLKHDISGIASRMLKERSPSTFITSFPSPRKPSAIPQPCLQATLSRLPLPPPILPLRLGTDMIRLINRSDLRILHAVSVDDVLGCHQWNLDQSRLYQHLSPDQRLEHPRHHSKLLLCTEDPNLSKTPMKLTMNQLGNLLGCLLTAFFGEYLGRKNTLRVGAGLSTIGAILQFSATTFPQLIVGRVINGIGNGILTSVLLLSVPDSEL